MNKEERWWEYKIFLSNFCKILRMWIIKRPGPSAATISATSGCGQQAQF